MFKRNFLRSLACCLVLAWALTGYYPFGFDFNPMNPFDPIEFIALFVLVAAAFLCGIGGLLAAIVCLYTYAGMRSGGGVASDLLTRERMTIVPWAAPFAMLWLGGWVLRFETSYFGGDISGLTFAVLSLIFGTILIFVIAGTFARLFPSKNVQTT